MKQRIAVKEFRLTDVSIPLRTWLISMEIVLKRTKMGPMPIFSIVQEIVTIMILLLVMASSHPTFQLARSSTVLTKGYNLVKISIYKKVLL